jgi:hypothetical protein
MIRTRPLDFRAVFDIFRRIDAEILSLIERSTTTPARRACEFQRSDVAPCGIEMHRTVQMRAEVVGVRQKLPFATVGGEAIEEFHLQRLIGRPRRRQKRSGS